MTALWRGRRDGPIRTISAPAFANDGDGLKVTRGSPTNLLCRVNLLRVVIRVHDVEVRPDAGFDALFEEQYPKLVSLGTALCGSREVARELAQETMLRAYRHWNDVGAFDRPDAWLRKVMTNLLIDHHRSSGAERSAWGRVRQPVVAQAELGEWECLVAGLPMRQRMIVTLFYGEDRSIDEISQLLGVSSGTVKAALSRARQRLLRALTMEEVGNGS
jgi:RNA polymerase sigma-70 factor, ECF subfamily